MLSKRLLILILVIIFSAPGLALALNVSQVAATVGNPAGLESWLQAEFKYVGEAPDYWQTAQETLRLKSGDCEDFAIMNKEILNKMGLAAEVYVLRFRGLSQMHAVCVFANNGVYSILSNKKLIPTGEASAQGALRSVYPDLSLAEAATVVNGRMIASGASDLALGGRED